MSIESRLSELESRLDPHPHAVAVVYRHEVAEAEDAPTTLTDEESELCRTLLAEALEAAPYAQGYTLYLSEHPHWKMWE